VPINGFLITPNQEPITKTYNMFKKTIEKPKEGLTYGEILDRFILLDAVKELPGDKLCFARRKNLMHLRKFEKANSATSRIPLTSDFEAYQCELSELRGSFLLTDKEGKTVMQHNANESIPLVDVANSTLITKQNELKVKYKSAIQEREDDIKAYTGFMDEVVPAAELPPIHEVNSIDASGLSQDQVDAIYWFIKEAE
jgi:hypothetical protein